ncbi:MAG: DUF402 domain-containing protein [Halolamina sp.]
MAGHVSGPGAGLSPEPRDSLRADGGSPEPDPAADVAAATTADEVAARVRGIYATALTRLLLDAGHEVVAASPPIRRRFDHEFPAAGHDVAVETTADRRGLRLTGDAEAVAALRALSTDLALDALSWPASLPAGTVVDGVVTETLGSGAVVDCGDGEAFLPYDDADGYVDAGDAVRAQVREPAPPWSDNRPELATETVARAGLATLIPDRDGTTVEHGDDAAARELVGMTDLLDVAPPDGWGLRWAADATDADLDALAVSLSRAREVAETVATAREEPTPTGADAPRVLAAPRAGVWVWLGRAARFALDEHRQAVTATMPGHHRTKATTPAASAGVDFVEALCDLDDDDDAAFPFEVVSGRFGPTVGDRVAIGHGKPTGRYISLGRGEVVEVDADGTVAVERRMTGGGTYDALGTTREAGDTALTRFREGRWWYPTAYRGEDGASKGTYVNVCTPVEAFPDVVRYVDLEVDVVKYPDGAVEVVDEDELAAAVDAGHVTEALAEKARRVARGVERALSE